MASLGTDGLLYVPINGPGLVPGEGAIFTAMMDGGVWDATTRLRIIDHADEEQIFVPLIETHDGWSLATWTLTAVEVTALIGTKTNGSLSVSLSWGTGDSLRVSNSGALSILSKWQGVGSAQSLGTVTLGPEGPTAVSTDPGNVAELGTDGLIFVSPTAGSAHVIQDEGVALTNRAALNFVGSGVTVTDDAGNGATLVTITAGAVASVNGETGAVSLSAADVGAEPAKGADDNYVTAAEKAALAALPSTYGRAHSVLAHGAVGDGIADDTASIQAADDTAASVATGTRRGFVEVYFPAGNYRTTSTIHKSPRTVWTGPGVRYVDSVNAARKSQGARIISDHAGDAITITGPGAGSGINQHGAIRNLTIYGDAATYPNARGVVSTGDVREHYMDGVLVIGFAYSFHLTDGLAWHFLDCYNSNATKVGIYAQNCDEFTFERCQWAGGKYGGLFVGCGPMNGTGNRWQVSATASLKMIECASVNLQGGFFDSTSIMALGGSDRGYGLWLVNCQNVKIENFLAYSNGPVAHARIESLAGGREVDVDGSFTPGSGHTLTASNLGAGSTGSAGISLAGATYVPGAGATPAAVEFAQEVGLFMSDVLLGGTFRSTTPFVYAADAGGVDYAANLLPSVTPSPGAPMRTAHDIYLIPTGDAVRNIGSTTGRWLNIVGMNHQVFAAAGAANPVASLSTSGVHLGAGGSAVLDVVLGRSAANVAAMGAGDSLATDGTWDGGTFMLGAYRLWVDASGSLRIKSGAPASDTDGTSYAAASHAHEASDVSSGTLDAARLPTATETAVGAVELATTTEATTGTDTTRAVTPAGVKAVADTKAASSHTHAATDLASGTVATARLGSGTADSTTMLGGDQAYRSPHAVAQSINAQTGTTYTLVAGDAGKLVTCSNAAAITVTLPQDSDATIPIGSRIDFAVLGAGMVTFAAGTGATANGTPSLVTRAQYSAATCIKRAANTWLVVGDLA